MNAREREAQQQRRQSAADWADESGSFGPTPFQNPKGVKTYKMVQDVQDLDVIPFLSRCASLKSPKVDVGVEIWNRGYGRHKIPGPQGKDVHYLCLYETFGVPCPFCKKRSDRSLSKEMQDALSPQRRLVMLVNDKPGDQTNPLKVLNEAYYNRKIGFGEQLVNAIKMNRPHGDYFYDWEQKDGKTLRMMVTNEEYHQIGSIMMLPRSYSYPYHMVEQAPSLDECFIVPRPKSLDGVPYDQFTENDWKAVQDEIWDLLNGGCGSSISSVSVPATPPKQEELPTFSPPASTPTPAPTPIPPTPRVEQKPAPQPTSPPNPTSGVKAGTSPGCPYKKGDKVLFHGLACEVKVVEGGRLLTLLDPDGELFEDVPFASVKPLSGVKLESNGNGSSSPPAQKAQAAQVRKGLDDDDDLEDLNEDENE